MLDIALTFFENLTPEMIAFPFAFFQAEKAPYDDYDYHPPYKKAEAWDGYVPPPSNQELVRQIKDKKRENKGQNVDITEWSNVLNMLANEPIEYLIAVKDDIVLPELKTPYFTGAIQYDGQRIQASKNREKIHERYAALSKVLVPEHAKNLSHNADSKEQSIIEWGLEIEHAAGRFLNESLKTVRKNSFHQKNHAKPQTQSLKDVFETSRVGMLERAFIKMVTFHHRGPVVDTGYPQWAKLKMMDFDHRMTHALDVLANLEEACKKDIADGKTRIQSYEDTQKTISTFYDILETYHDLLDAEAPRLKREEAEWFQAGGDPSDKLRAKFKDTSLKVKDDIASRLHALRKTLHVCEIEYGAYETMISAEKRSWESIQHLIQTQIPMFRQQLIQAQNIKAGHEAVQMDNLSEGLQKLTGQKLRDAAAKQIIDGVYEEIGNAEKTLDTIAQDEVKAITKAETLMIEDQRPIAMIEDQREHEVAPS